MVLHAVARGKQNSRLWASACIDFFLGPLASCPSLKAGSMGCFELQKDWGPGQVLPHFYLKRAGTDPKKPDEPKEAFNRELMFG